MGPSWHQGGSSPVTRLGSPRRQIELTPVVEECLSTKEEVYPLNTTWPHFILTTNGIAEIKCIAMNFVLTIREPIITRPIISTPNPQNKKNDKVISLCMWCCDPKITVQIMLGHSIVSRIQYPQDQ